MQKFKFQFVFVLFKSSGVGVHICLGLWYANCSFYAWEEVFLEQILDIK